MKKTLWLVFVTVACGIGLSLLNFWSNGKQGWNVFSSGGPVICLLVTFLVGLILGWFAPREWITTTGFVLLVVTNFWGLNHLPGWVIVINIVVQFLFFVFGMMFAGLGKPKTNYRDSPDLDDEEASRNFKEHSKHL